MGQLDIVARLQLRADQFASESGARFAELKTRAQSAAQDVRQSFTSSFADIQKIARQSIELPRTERGSLNLSGEIASLNASAAAAENRADAFREMQQAALRAAAGESAHSEALRRDADAAMVAVRAEEEAAAADRRRVSQLEALQAELNRTASVTMQSADAFDTYATKQLKAGNQSGQLRSAMQGLSYQAQDTFTQLSMGANPLNVLAIQGGQAAGAFAGLQGKAGAFASFLIGPWGLALTGAALVVGKLTDGMFEESEAAKAAREALEKHRDAVLDLARAQEKAIQTGERKQALDTAQIQSDLNAALATRKRLAATLDAAKADLVRAAGINSGSEGGIDVSTVVGATLDRQIAALTAAMGENANAIGTLEKGFKLGFARLVGMSVDARSTPEGRIRRDYERRRADAMSDPANQGVGNADRLRSALSALNVERDRELKAIEKTTRTRRDSDTATPASVVALLRRELPGVSIGATTNGKHVAGSDHYKSAAVDFTPKGGMGSMTKAEVRALFERAGIPIRRNAAGVEQLFGPGDKGHSDHFHVAWEKGKVALDNYRASQRLTEAGTRALDREQDELAATLERVQRALDPAAHSASEYAASLADIDRLQAKGTITPGQAFEYRANAMDQRNGGTRATGIRGIFGEAAVDATNDQWEANARSAADTWGREIEEGAERATDVLREGVYGVAEMLGLRVRGPLGALLDGRGQITDQQAAKISEAVNSLGLKLPREMGKVVQGASTAVAIGQLGSAAGKVAGLKQSGTGSAIGGLVGGLTPLGPAGAAIGGLIGGTIGGLFAKTKKGSSTLTFGADGLEAGGAIGNSAAAKAAAAASASSVAGSLARIAETLGGSVTGAGSVSIGKRKDQFVVDTTGRGRTKGAGVNSYATEEAAIRAAIADALRDGVVGGISDASKRILQAGGDLEKAITKASLIESVPKSLKAMLDPMGAAVDAVNEKFGKIVDALKEGGASAEQMAQTQQLYNLELDQAKASAREASATLKEFRDGLILGGLSPLSLRDQEAAARTALDPFLKAIEVGQSVDQSKYQAAAQSYLDVERQLYGSTSKFFEAFDAVQAATAQAIATIDNAVPVSAGVASPFAKETAASAAATAAGVQTGNEMTQDTNDLLAQIAGLMQQVAANTGGDTGGGFIGTGRLFAA